TVAGTLTKNLMFWRQVQCCHCTMEVIQNLAEIRKPVNMRPNNRLGSKASVLIDRRAHETSGPRWMGGRSRDSVLFEAALNPARYVVMLCPISPYPLFTDASPWTHGRPAHRHVPGSH